jgi:hypothetical protein
MSATETIDATELRGHLGNQLHIARSKSSFGYPVLAIAELEYLIELMDGNPTTEVALNEKDAQIAALESEVTGLEQTAASIIRENDSLKRLLINYWEGE